jgi:hypothetical protein
MWDAVWNCLRPQLWHISIIEGSAIPPISVSQNPPPPQEAYQSKGAPMCPSTAYQGAKTLCCITNNVDVGYSLGPLAVAASSLNHYDPWHHNTVPPPASAQKRNSATRVRTHMSPSTAYQDAKTLCMYMIWMWDVVWDLLQPQPWHHNTARAQHTHIFP